MDKGFEKQVRDALGQLTGWAPIDVMVDHVSQQVEIPVEFSQTALRKSLSVVVRRQLKTFKDDDGLAQWESIERQNADGESERVYKQLAMFDKDDYRVSIDYYANSGRYYIRKANTLAVRCNKIHHTRLPLPFPAFGVLKDEEAATA